MRSKTYQMAAGFAILNLIMYFTIGKFWIGGSSFLPLIGQLGTNYSLLFAFLVNVGVMLGAFLRAKVNDEFLLRFPKKHQIHKLIIGGFLIGVGITLTPGTCTTAIVVGLPMLSISSLLSIAGIFMGGYIAFRMKKKACRIDRRL